MKHPRPPPPAPARPPIVRGPCPKCGLAVDLVRVEPAGRRVTIHRRSSRSKYANFCPANDEIVLVGR
jgi:hypothetical protein